MDYSYIQKIAGAETARKLCNADLFNDHMGTAEEIPTDWKDLDGILKGATILGVDPISYPSTDGVYLHIKLTSGEIVNLLVEAEDELDVSLPAVLKVCRYKM